MINRRGLITGLISLVAAPAIVRASSLMPVKVIKPISYMTLDDYAERIMLPMIEKMQEQIASSIMYGESYFKYSLNGIAPVIEPIANNRIFISKEEALKIWPYRPNN